MICGATLDLREEAPAEPAEPSSLVICGATHELSLSFACHLCDLSDERTHGIHGGGGACRACRALLSSVSLLTFVLVSKYFCTTVCAPLTSLLSLPLPKP